MAKAKFDFSAVEDMAKKLNAIDSELTKQAVEKSLQRAQHLVTEQTKAAMAKHKEYSRKKADSTENSIFDDGVVEWTADTVASINVGFDLNKSGLVSIFLMKGTKLHGQPHIEPDRELYNAIYGSATKKKIQAIAQEEFNKAMQEAMK